MKMKCKCENVNELINVYQMPHNLEVHIKILFVLICWKCSANAVLQVI